MTATVTDVDTIEHLDWQLACESTSCQAGNPTATHILHGSAPCGCSQARLLCKPCASRFLRHWWCLHLWKCTKCGNQFVGIAGDWCRIEALS